LSFTGMVLTNQGLTLQSKVQAGTALAFTRIKIGNGMLATGQSLETLTDLIDPQEVVAISSVSVVSGNATISGATPGLPGDNATVRHSLWVSAPLASCLESIEKRWGFVLSRDPLAALAPTITPLQPQRSLSPSWLRRGVAGLD
jgi:hypothetical protein